MKVGELKDWVMLAALVGGGYWLYTKFKGGADAASKGIADAYVRLTAGPVIEVLPKVVLPDGRKIDVNGLVIKPDATFVYGGKKYRMTKRRPDNDYDSVLAGFRR